MDYSIVVPLYNEEEVIAQCYKKLSEVMSIIEGSYEIVFVNDGSKDRTMDIAIEIAKNDNNIKIISFSRNFGHQSAITAGMSKASGEAIVVIDADLQDPPSVIIDMIDKWKQGYDVVYGKRIKRRGETFFKKISAKIFYRLLNALTDVDIPTDVGDFRLLDKKVVNALNELPEHSRYVRGLVSWVGFKQTAVEYVREERFAGETKYPLHKMLKFATDAVTSFSDKPLKISIFIGILLSVSGFIYLIVVIYMALFTNATVAGWASLAAISLFFNGVVLIMLGIIGQYIGRIYDETKARPLYIISETVGFDESK